MNFAPDQKKTRKKNEIQHENFVKKCLFIFNVAQKLENRLICRRFFHAALKNNSPSLKLNQI